ncbi:MAG: C10 family peptidase [Bacteroidales bacterium]|nr:C10 family peptidase [Bacteroidales bacterium]
MNRMLKIFCISAVLLLLAHGVSAKPVDATRARRVAENYMQAKGMRNTSALADVTAQTPFTEFYVFAAPEGGFILVSGDDCAVPVLGYSTTSRFETKDMPENIVWWLRGYEEEIKSGKLKVNSECGEWALLEAGEMPVEPLETAVSPMLTTTWNQGNYYNNLCPYHDSTSARSVTGCVATATAQVMKFWNHPTTGYGSNTYTSSRTRNGIHYEFPNLTANFGATTYDWSNMPNALTSASSTTQVNAVATLMYHVGVAVEMSYSPVASGAHNYNYRGVIVPSSQTALMKHFKYRADMAALMREDYGNAEFGVLLRAELDQNRPILYSGSNVSGGHSFVFDGYNASGMFHVNWGWGGSSDGYFVMGSLNPGVGGIGGNSSGTYNMDNVALIGIRPHTGWSTTGTTTVTVTTTGHGSATGSGTYSFGDTVTMLATANSGYRFKGWSDGCKFNPREIIANGGSYTFTAEFEAVTGDTLHFCPGWHNITSYGYSSGGDNYWGIHLTASMLNPDSSLKAVQFYVTETGTYDVTIYKGTNHNTVMQRDTVTFVSGDEDQWHTLTLTNPVAATNDLWIIMHYSGAGYPQAGTYYSGAAGSFVCGSSLNDAAASRKLSAMVRGIFCSCIAPVDSSCYLTTFPYEETFDGLPPCWDIIDSNADGTTWGFYSSGGYNGSSCMRIKWANNSDDWLMTPPIAIAGNYTVAWKARIHSATYPETYQVLWYDGNTATQLFQETLSSTTMVDRSVNFTVPATGSGRIVFRYISDDMYYLYLDNVVISQVAPTPQYTITTASNNNAWGTVTGGGTYAQGTPIQIEAIPATGYRFVRWQDNNTQNPRPFTVTANATYTATFEPIICTVYVSSNNTDWGTVTGGGTYQYGTTSVTLSAQPNTGYHFVQWQDGNTQNIRQITVISDTTFTATFEADPVPQYTVTVTSNNNDWGTVSGGGIFAEGTQIDIVATPHEGYRFVQWQDGVTDSLRTVTVTADITYTATFDSIPSDPPTPQYTVSVNCVFHDGHSNDYISSLVTGAGIYNEGDTVILEGFVQGCATSLDFWIIETGDTIMENPYTFVIHSDRTITAVFGDYGGIGDVDGASLRLWPNPTNGVVTLSVTEPGEVSVMDVTGRTVLKQQVTAGDNRIDVGSLIDGLYFMKMGSKHSSFIIQH